MAGELFLSPYLSEIMEVAFFIVDFWWHREIHSEIGKLETDLKVINNKLDQMLNTTVGDQNFDANFVNSPVKHQSVQIATGGTLYNLAQTFWKFTLNSVSALTVLFKRSV